MKRIKRSLPTVCIVSLVLAHALFADGIMDRWGMQGFSIATIITYTALLIYWICGEYKRGIRHEIHNQRSPGGYGWDCQ